MNVPARNVALDMAHQRGDGIEGATPHQLARQDAEPHFDQVQPGRPRGGEV